MTKPKSKTLVVNSYKVTPKPLLRRSLAKKVQKEIRAKKISINDLFKDLKKERRQYKSGYQK